MENATFTLAEITGVSAWEALATVWWVPVLLFILGGGHIMIELLVRHYYGTRLHNRIQWLRWKIAAHICPLMDDCAQRYLEPGSEYKKGYEEGHEDGYTAGIADWTFGSK